ncbi:MAG: methyltransferase domain-containing protein [Anaerolineae bacterium]|nr:methyltransferase domain-containing protein [Anaerolineae bacterium]
MMTDKRYGGEIERMRAPQRVALMEMDRVLELALAGVTLKSLLDVGTGSGLWAEVFAQRGLTVTGVDVREDMLAAAQAFVPGATFKQGEMESLPFPDESFDLVFLGLVLHEATGLATALREMYRVANLRVVALEWPYEVGEMGPPQHHRLRAEDVLREARAAGYAQAEHIQLTHMALYRLDKRNLQPWCV